MNRAIALFVALAMLLAHTLAIHNDGEGSFGFPYEQAYIALRLGRNLVHEGQLAWNPGTSAFESYPSVVWVLVCAAAERVGPTLRLSTNVLVQSVGIASALGTLIVVSRFRRERVASLIAPLYLAVGGAFAAAAANGLETTAFTLLAASSFLALERGRAGLFAACSALLCLTRPEGLALVAALAFVRAFGRPNEDEGTTRRVAWAAFAAPVLAVLVMAAARYAATGFVIDGETAALFAPHPGQLASGVLALRDFALVGVTPLLLVFPALFLVRGSLSRTGSHAVFLALAWFALCVLRGRGTQPFHEALVPALPFLCLAVQEGMIAALDGVSPLRRRLTLLAFAAGLFGSALASRLPADLGPIPWQSAHEQWVRPTGSARHGLEQPLGRLGLIEELAVTGHLRRVGIFLRGNVEPGAAVLTPWPGAIGYLSRHAVFDLYGRCTPLRTSDRPRSWSRRETSDVAAWLDRDLDFVVPWCRPARNLPTMRDTAREWMEDLDESPPGPERLERIETALARYELVAVPVEDYTPEGVSVGRETLLLLRNRKLEQRPTLELDFADNHIRVRARHTNHPQIADLDLRLEDVAGQVFCLRPTGTLAPGASARARVGLLLYAGGTRAVELLRAPLPAHPRGVRWVRVTAQLVNPGSTGLAEPWAEVSAAVSAAP